MEDPKQSMGGISTYFDYLYKVKSIFSMCNVVLGHLISNVDNVSRMQGLLLLVLVLDRLPVLTLEVILQSFVELFETLCCTELGSELCKKGLLGGGSAGMSARPSLLNTS